MATLYVKDTSFRFVGEKYNPVWEKIEQLALERIWGSYS